jgi:hypothetical protein
MSKHKKEKMGYDPKPIRKMCSNCVHFASDVIAKTTYGHEWNEEKNIRCLIGEFAVKKTALCDIHILKPTA